MKILISKCEHLTQIVLQRECELFPSTSLFKLFDPFGFILAHIFEYSKKENIPINELKVKLRRLKGTLKIEGMVIRGLILRGAFIPQENDYLRPESSLDFENELPYANLEIIKRDTLALNQSDQYIPVEFVDEVHKDLEWQYLEQQN